MKQPTGKQITSVGHYHSDTELTSCQSFWYATCVQWKKIYILQCIIINSWNNQKLLFSLWAYRPFDLVSMFSTTFTSKEQQYYRTYPLLHYDQLMYWSFYLLQHPISVHVLCEFLLILNGPIITIHTHLYKGCGESDITSIFHKNFY